VGAEVAAKAAKLTRIVNRVSKLPGFNGPRVVKSLEKLQEVVLWMSKYPICFVAGTPVHTADGLKNIEDIREGDLVLSRNENAPDSAPAYRRVLSTVVTHPTRLYHVRLVVQGTKSFETLSGTGEHPFYVVNRSVFVPAKELQQGDILSLSDGRTALLAEVAIENAKPGETFTTYNFEVADHHTYFVGKSGVWVHNAGNPCDRAFDVFVQAKRAGKSDTDAVLDARQYLNGLDIGNVERARHHADFDKILKKSIDLNTIDRNQAFNLPGPNSGLIFIRGEESMPIHAKVFQDETLGSFPNISPSLRFDNPTDGGFNFVKFDGFVAKADGTIELIDAKTEVAIGGTPGFIPDKIVKQLQSQGRAIAQNGSRYRGVIEVPTDEVAARVDGILKQNNIGNLEVRVRGR
jgi:hypothetical protein